MQKIEDEKNLVEIFSRAARIPRRKIDEALKKATILEVIENHFLITDATSSERRRMEELISFCSLYESTSKMEKTGYQIFSPEDTYNYLAPEMKGLSYERVDMLILNTRHRLIKRETIATGDLTSAVPGFQKIARTAVIYNAAYIILAHNHPSGNPQPSEGDIAITRNIVKAFDTVGIEFVDHLVIGRNSFKSMMVEGLIEKNASFQAGMRERGGDCL